MATDKKRGLSSVKGRQLQKSYKQSEPPNLTAILHAVLKTTKAFVMTVLFLLRYLYRRHHNVIGQQRQSAASTYRIMQANTRLYYWDANKLN